MTKINDIWNEQEKDSSSTGLLLRRYSATVLPDVYIGFRKSEGQRCLVLSLHNSNNIHFSRYDNLKDIKLELMPDDKDVTKSFLLILLVTNQHADVFATVCEDLIARISEVRDDDKLAKEILNRLEKWKSLFDKASSEGLNMEEQRGLFGELYFIRKWINNSDECRNSILSWVGPENGVRDFQLTNWGLEVKTTRGNNHQKIHISSERQLDTANITSLFLLHLSLEVQQQNGETLNNIADEITGLLMTDIATQAQFRSKLLQAGYFNHHRQLYENTGYQIRQENCYLVNNDFPRIEERDIRRGVGDVKYSVILSEYTDYIITEPFLFETINQHGE